MAGLLWILRDPLRLEANISKRNKVVILVHIFGQTADMDPICEIARCDYLGVIKDACQANGALYGGRKTGSLSDAGAFNFNHGKNLGA
jgi:dTDP-4-amino-4,6-dideoxygalactose transaminase